MGETARAVEPGTRPGMEGMFWQKLGNSSKEAEGMTIFEDMCSKPERMAEYLACWLTCANCPGQAMCDREERDGNHPGCAEMIVKKLKEAAE